MLDTLYSLAAAGVTVWELGVVHRGAWAQRYWSSSGCLYHHAYPVGYRATKVRDHGTAVSAALPWRAGHVVL